MRLLRELVQKNGKKMACMQDVLRTCSTRAPPAAASPACTRPRSAQCSGAAARGGSWPRRQTARRTCDRGCDCCGLRVIGEGTVLVVEALQRRSAVLGDHGSGQRGRVVRSRDDESCMSIRCPGERGNSGRCCETGRCAHCFLALGLRVLTARFTSMSTM